MRFPDAPGTRPNTIDPFPASLVPLRDRLGDKTVLCPAYSDAGIPCGISDGTGEITEWQAVTREEAGCPGCTPPAKKLEEWNWPCFLPERCEVCGETKKILLDHLMQFHVSAIEGRESGVSDHLIDPDRWQIEQLDMEHRATRERSDDEKRRLLRGHDAGEGDFSGLDFRAATVPRHESPGLISSPSSTPI